MLPSGFVYLEDPRIIQSLNYYTPYNFLGRRVSGYKEKVCILTEKMSAALSLVQDELDHLNQGYVLKIFDAYRPITAVQDFKAWSLDLSQQEMKAEFYPHISKAQLFELGYISETSTHSRGSAVDLTITQKNNNSLSHTQTNSENTIDLNMGTIFDFFDETANTLSKNISETAKKNRIFLKTLMEKHGFINYPLEWWHYTLKNEPFPDSYFDFPIQKSL